MSKLIVAAILAVFMCATYSYTYAAPTDEIVAPTPLAEENYRLPDDILPVHYELFFQPYLLATDGDKRFTFDGEATIEIQPNKTTNTIVLHTKNLKYSKREYWSAKDTTNVKTLDAYDINEVTDKITYTLNENLQSGETYYLHFVYNGTMDDDMHGFYRSTYNDTNNNEKWLGSTQFQTNHARRAFPSFDEPKFKAKFTVSIKRHNSMNTFANTALDVKEKEGDYYTDTYKQTPKMSTYILAFIVSEFQERKTTSGDFGVLSRPDFYNQTVYSFEVGQKILSALETYLNEPYKQMGVDKMHMAAIPDFSAGAMENWGLLTYRERSLLFDESSSSLSSKQSIAGVIAHEQAHMWFGDLITCEWWSYTWLNEGFARYFQYFGTHMVENEFEMDKQFPVDQLQVVMAMDSTNSTNPLSDENTNTPADLSRMFNSISYNKGGSFIRMVQHAMGEENFQKSLQSYLDKYPYQNTVPKNIFDEWKTNWPAEFATYADGFFKNFTEQVGYPLVTIHITDNNQSLEVSQKRFLLKDDDGADPALLYTIPITYTTNIENDFNKTSPKFFLEASTTAHNITLEKEIDWVIGNIQETGYYRVNYNEELWRRIQSALRETNWSGIHELNRAQIVDDLLNLARASVITYELALDILEYLETETNYLPWVSAFNGYSFLAIRLGTDTKNFGVYIRELTEKAYKELGFEEASNNTSLEIYNRAKILAWNCKYGSNDCVSQAKSYFKNMETTPVPVNIRSVVYCTAMREGNEADFNLLFNKYKEATVPTEQVLILNNLGCVKNSALVEKFFWIVVGDDVRRQDKSSALSTLYTENNENISPVFKLVTDNFEQLAESMGSYSSVATVISNIASRFTEEKQESDLKTFNTNNKSKFGSSASTLEAAEKTVAENIKWAKLKLGTFKQYLNKRVGNGAAGNVFTVFTLVACALVALLLQ